MATLKEQLALNAKTTADNVAKTDDRKEKQELAQVGLIQAIALQMLIDEVGENADFETHSAKFKELSEEIIPKDELIMNKVYPMKDPVQMLNHTQNPRELGDHVKLINETRDDIKKNLKERADKGDYKGMVDYALQIGTECGKEPDADMTAIRIGSITAYFTDLSRPRELTEEELKNPSFTPPIPDKDAAVIKGFVEEFTSRMVKHSMEGIKVTQKLEEDIRSGKYKETLLVNDDPRIPRKLAEQMMFNQTEVGQTLRVFEVVAESAYNANMGSGLIDGQPIATYFGEARRIAVDKQLAKDFPELYQKLPKDKGEKGEKLDGFYRPPRESLDIEGFTLKTGILPKGASPFAKVPPTHAKYLNMSVAELLMEEAKAKGRHILEENGNETLKAFASSGKALEDALKAAKPKKPSQAYKNVELELENLKKIGQVGYKISGPINDPEDGTYQKTDGMAPKYIKNYFSRMKDVVKEYAKENPSFNEKFEAFRWAQKQRFHNELNLPKGDASLSFIQKVKKVRNIEESYSLEYAYRDARMSYDEKMNTAKWKYNNAKLRLRGSNEYKEVGDALSQLEDLTMKMAEKETRFQTARTLNSAESQRALMEDAKAIQAQIKILREKTAAYYMHKAKDGQWRENTNANADRRIDAVKAVDEVAETLSRMMDIKVEACKETIRKDLEARTPDYAIWSELYPKPVEDYKANGEPVPDGVEAFENDVKKMKNLGPNSIFMNTAMEAIGYLDEEYRSFSESIGKLTRCLVSRKELDGYNISEQEFTSALTYHLQMMCDWLTKGDNFNHLMEAADYYDQMVKKKENTTKSSIVESLETINKVFKTKIPAKEMANNYESKKQFEKQKKEFIEQAVDIYARHIQEYKIDQYLKAHPNFTKEQIKEVHEMNDYDVVKDTQENKTYMENVRKSPLFTDFMKTIKGSNSLQYAKDMIGDNNGKELYDYINNEKFRAVDLDKQLADAQQRIKGAKNPDSNEYPDKDTLRSDYAIITTAHLMKDVIRSNQISPNQLTVKSFEHFTESMMRKESFKEMMKQCSNEQLYTNAVKGNGKELCHVQGSMKNAEGKAIPPVKLGLRANMGGLQGQKEYDGPKK